MQVHMHDTNNYLLNYITKSRDLFIWIILFSVCFERSASQEIDS